MLPTDEMPLVAQPSQGEREDPRALLLALGKNEMYAKKQRAASRHVEESESW